MRSHVLTLLSVVWVCVAMAGQISPVSHDTSSVDPNTRFSPLAQIDRSNVARLKLVFSFRTGRLGAQGSPPLVIGKQLLLLSAFPHTLFAIDLTKAGAAPSWEITPAANRNAAGLNCCDRTHFGPVDAAGRVYFSTLDGHVIAVDPAGGKQLWDVAVADPHRGETLASAPTVVADSLFIGNAGDDFGARGWIAALDSSSGRSLWKHYSTGPDQEVGIPADFRPGQRDLGAQTWPADAWQRGGGSVAGWIAYDPDLKLLFHNTGPPAPWNPEGRPGANRWTSGVFARDPQTGAARWFTSLHAHNLFAWRNGASNVLVTRNWGGETRSLLIHPDADGHVYILDQHSGELLAADVFIPGLPDASSSNSQAPGTNQLVRGVCPAWTGAVGGDAALSPVTGYLYIPANRLCMDIEGRNANYIQGTAFLGANVRVSHEPGSPRGAIIAWDVQTHKAVWSTPEDLPLASDVIASAGGIVFYGTLNGTLKAIDAQSGALLWSFRTAAPLMGQPTTYLGPDGRQYVAVIAGASGPFGLAQQAWIDRRDETAARGLARVMANAPTPRDPSGTLYVFSLP